MSTSGRWPSCPVQAPWARLRHGPTIKSGSAHLDHKTLAQLGKGLLQAWEFGGAPWIEQLPYFPLSATEAVRELIRAHLCLKEGNMQRRLARGGWWNRNHAVPFVRT